MAFSKVTLNGDTLMDVTQKTVTAASMLSGTTALKNDGTDITGNIATKTSANLSASGATVTAPAGYYASDASKSVATGTAGTPTATKGTVSNHAVSVTPSVTNTEGYISGGTKTGTAVSVSASELVSGTKSITASGTTDVTNYASASVAAGSATTPATSITANPTISVDSSGLITSSVSTSQSVTPTVSAGYVSSGTAGVVSVSGSATEQLTAQAATTYHPSTTDQTIASGKYLTGAQTIKAVVTTNLTAANIADGVTVKIGDSTDDDCVASITGTHSGGGGGLEYEEGTFTPTTDIARQTISYANSHDEPAAFVGIYDATNNNAVNGSNVFWQAVNVDSISGANIYASSSSSYVGYFCYGYKSSDTAITTAFVNLTSFGSWTTSSDFLAYSQSSTRYWRSGRTYKWIAVWAPTT